jgi:glutamate-1-semialdehyde 2,1-aminomutase
MFSTVALGAAGAGSLVLLVAAKSRLDLSRAKHRSLAGHARWGKRIAALVRFYAYEETAFFRCDKPPEEIASHRQIGFEHLAALYARKYPKGRALAVQARASLSDLQFIDAYRVPFQFRAHVAEQLGSGVFYEASDGVTLTDVDGNRLYDLAGSYGVNLLGYDVYKQCIAEAVETVGKLGPVLGAYHPVVLRNVERLRRISGKAEVSFHMSGTEAVMQAVRLARYHTAKRRIVRFCGAYHGWWGDVQPGIGNPMTARDTLTLAEMSERTLKVLDRRRDIACVLVNPLQALHPNGSAPGDSTLTDSSRRAGFDRAAYADWLHRLREVCSLRGIVLIFDEVFVGFRLAPGGAQEYFEIEADLVTYGKTIAGGLPIGVLCGPHALMKRYRDDRPAEFNFARGTFHSHPYVMGAMDAFLTRFECLEVQRLYEGLDARWNERAAALNVQLEERGHPVKVANLSTIWTMLYTRPSRYNWMLQYYLRAEGLALSWVGTGRFIFSLNYTDADFAAVADRFVAAADGMAADGWWWDGHGLSDKAIRRTILGEMLRRTAV